MSWVAQRSRTAGMGRAVPGKTTAAFWAAEDEMASPVVASAGVVQMAPRAPSDGRRANGPRRRWPGGRAFFSRSRHATIVSASLPAVELPLRGARKPSYHCTNKQYRCNCRFSFFFFFFLKTFVRPIIAFRPFKYYSFPSPPPSPLPHTTCREVFSGCSRRRPSSVPRRLWLFFMEANESNEVQTTGTPPTSNGGGGTPKTSTEPSPAGSKILSKNSNGTSECERYLYVYLQHIPEHRSPTPPSPPPPFV